MISDTQMAYGSRVHRHGRSRAFPANHLISGATMERMCIGAEAYRPA